MKHISHFTLALIFVNISVTGFSQDLSKKELEPAIIKIAKLISDEYVFPEKGKLIATSLLREYKNGKFNQIKDWKAFDSIITQNLRRLSSDGHLFVRNDIKRVKKLLEAQSKVIDSNTTEQVIADPFFYNADAVNKNFGFLETKILDGNIGYIKLSEINISIKSLPVLFGAMAFVSNTKALILDLRGNGGGGSELGLVFHSFFLPNDIPILEIKTRNNLNTIIRTAAWLTEKKYENPLFIIVNKRTASAAEELAYTMQYKKRAIIVGQQSAGAANMSSWYVVNDQLYLSVSTAAPTIPGTTDSWEQIGITPDYIVEKGFEVEFIQQLIKKSNQ